MNNGLNLVLLFLHASVAQRIPVFFNVIVKKGMDLPFGLSLFAIIIHWSVFQSRLAMRIVQSANMVNPEASETDNFCWGACKIEISTFFIAFIYYYAIFHPYLLIACNAVLWLPQIYLNVIHNSRKSPTLEYIISVSIQHIFVPVSIFMNPYNPFDFKPNYGVALCIIASMIIEILVLIIQRRKGAQYFIPVSLRTIPIYEYTRKLPENSIAIIEIVFL